MKYVFAILTFMLLAACSKPPQGTPPGPVPPGPNPPIPKPPLSACNYPEPKKTASAFFTDDESGRIIFPALIGGNIVDPKDWPVSIWIGNCSATVVGKRVIASAAHCMRNGATVSFNLASTRYSAKCTHHPEYRRNSTADWAICVTDKDVEGGPFENLNTDKNLVSLGDQITLSGYGCRVWGGSIDGKFRTGESPVIQVPSGTNYDIVTRGRAALCSGDSGGAAYKVLPDGKRFVIALNSRSNTTTTSYIPSVAQPTALSFFRDWSDANDTKICGIHTDAVGCRDMKIEPPPPVHDFEVNAYVACVRGKMKPSFEHLLETVKTKIKQALDM